MQSFDDFSDEHIHVTMKFIQSLVNIKLVIR